MKISQIFYSDSSDSIGGKHVSELRVRPLLIFLCDMEKISNDFCFISYVLCHRKSTEASINTLRHASLDMDLQNSSQNKSLLS